MLMEVCDTFELCPLRFLLSYQQILRKEIAGSICGIAEKSTDDRNFSAAICICVDVYGISKTF